MRERHICIGDVTMVGYEAAHWPLLTIHPLDVQLVVNEKKLGIALLSQNTHGASTRFLK